MKILPHGFAVAVITLVMQQPASADQLRMAALGCLDHDDATTAFTLMVNEDDAAFMKFATVKVIAGQCATMHAGTYVELNEFSMWSGMACVRPRGEYNCYWVSNHLLVK